MITVNRTNPMPQKRPDHNQIAALIVARAAGIEPPKAVKPFAGRVKKVKGSTKRRK